MTSIVGTYDFRNSTLNFGGQITGFADGDCVEIEEINDAFKDEGGAGGGRDFVKNNNNALSIKITLLQSSPSNAVLSAIHTLDRGVSTPLPFSFMDRTTGDTVNASFARIVKFPTIKRGNNIVQMEWMIKTGSDYLITLGYSK